VSFDKPSILIVDDDKNALLGYLKVLRQDNFVVEGAANGYEALKKIEQRSFDIMITDIRMPQLDGITLLKEVRKRNPDISVILVTAYGTIDSAVEAMKLGAETYLTKPVNIGGGNTHRKNMGYEKSISPEPRIKTNAQGALQVLFHYR
jgi:DNA-binding NtrC family response regulator